MEGLENVLFYKGKKMDETGGVAMDFHGFGDAIRKELEKRIPTDQDLKVLDVGTGMGNTAAFLLGHLPKDGKLWTVDPSSEVLARAREALSDLIRSSDGSGRIEFVEANADKLHFSDGFFDMAVSVMVMHHIQDLRASIKEFARVTKKKEGGRIVIVDYTPRASHELQFQSRHEEADFFAPNAVAGAGKEVGLASQVHDFGLWYLVDLRPGT